MMTTNTQAARIAFFGTPDIAVWVLEELEKAGTLPELIVTNPDRPQGRKLVLTPPPVKEWAKAHGIETLQPTSIKDTDELAPLTSRDWDLFLVVAYGGLLPEWLLGLPEHGALNMHPSLLPKLRGPSPIRSAILQDMRETGVTIMLLDNKMDHGPILAQEEAEITEDEWPLRGRELDERLARLGGQLLSKTIPQWLSGAIEPQEQDHEKATYCKKIEKSDGELALDPHDLPKGEVAYNMLLKIRAYDGWPCAYFMHEGKRIKITDAELAEDGSLCILRVIPEGGKEKEFQNFLGTLSS